MADITEKYLLNAQRWLEQGWSSTRNPVHIEAIRRFYAPLGIKCEYMYCASADPDAPRYPELVGTSWCREDISEGLEDLFPHPSTYEYLTIKVQKNGFFKIEQAKPAPLDTQSIIDAYLQLLPLDKTMSGITEAVAKFVEQMWAHVAMPTADKTVADLYYNLPDAVLRKFRPQL